ncbi:hypothetical protein [Hazenella coriacea]|uniref:Uncharacterized protein n=1 Tax=Hazenella coriacea TaxID=1179467 RepID=A0A4V2UVQ3_9BACL|nr:hypothetical protein [Hazenella coriacea]TCS96697.1 hypothetical protein EDD58_101334 [Hazenella coriacea]
MQQQEMTATQRDHGKSAFVLEEQIWSMVSIVLATVGFIMWIVDVFSSTPGTGVEGRMHLWIWTLIVSPIGIYLGRRAWKQTKHSLARVATIANIVHMLFIPILAYIGIIGIMLRSIFS